jgi:hypothetical protein
VKQWHVCYLFSVNAEFYGAANSPDFMESSGRLTESNEFGRMWKEVVMT